MAMAALAIHASAARTVWDGIYTEAQATRGRTPYMENCAPCHGEELISSDSNAPTLVGLSFSFVWNDTSVGEFLERTQTTMPSDRPKGLSRETYLDILAFILQANKYPPGDKDLNGELDALKQIQITAARPASTPH